MINYGIVSCASIVERFVEGIRESGEGYVYGIASRNIDRAAGLARKLDIPHFYGSYDELYDLKEIDVIYIPTMNSLHYINALKALEHHKHVIVEKPFTLKENEAIELFELARKNHCFIMEAQKSVFLPVNNKVKDMINHNIIGDIKYIDLKAGFPKRFDYDHWMYDLESGGGALRGSATYTIELLMYLFDEEIYDLNGDCMTCARGSDELCHFSFKMGEKLISSTIAMNVPLKNEMVLYGEEGYIVVDHFWKSRHFEVFLNNGNHEIYDLPDKSEFVYEIRHIHECIEKGSLESPIMNKEKTIEAIRIVNTLYRRWHLI